MKIAKLFCISILLGSYGASTPMKAVDADMLAAVTLHLTLPATWAYMWYQDIKNQQKNSIQTQEPTAPVAPITHKKQERLVKKTPESSTLLALLMLLIMNGQKHTN